jgi:iron uptake system component EfeO
MTTAMSIACRRTVASRAARYAATLTAIALLTGCAGTSTPPNSGTVLTVSATACGTGWRHPAAGLQTLQIHNAWTGAVEVTFIGATTGAVYAQVEALGPGTTQPMQVDLGSGAYAFQCAGVFTNEYTPLAGRTIVVPGHVRGAAGILPVSPTQMQTVTDEARAYIASGLAAVAREVTVLAADVKTGDLATARTVWLTAHLMWERLGSAYGMFGDYDDTIDGLPFGLPGGVHDPG